MAITPAARGSHEQTRGEMKKILQEIRSGQFAREWILENKANRPVFNATKGSSASTRLNRSASGCALMPWINAKSM